VALSFGTAVISDTGNTGTNTSLDCVRGQSSGMNLFVILGYALSATSMGFHLPDGFDLVLAEAEQSTGTPRPGVFAFAGDGSLGDAPLTWTNAGQAVCVCLPLIDTNGTPTFPYVPAVKFKAASNTDYSISGTTGADDVYLVTASVNKSGNGSAGYSGMTDTVDANASHNSALGWMVQHTAAAIAASTAWSRTITGPSTLIGTTLAIGIKAAPAAATGWPSARATGMAAAQAGAWAVSRAVDAWIADTPMWVAHRGGGDDWPEMTMQAYAGSVAWHPGVGLNFDLQKSSDGVYVGSHDATTGRVFGTDLTISSSTWSALSALRTTVGNQPMTRLDDFLDLYGGDPDQPVWLDNKIGDVETSTLLAWLDSNYAGWQEWLVTKGYYTQVNHLAAAKAKGGRTWMYLYAADLASHPTTADLAAASMFGMEYGANSTAWSTILGYSKPVLAHILDTAANKTTADTNSGGHVAGYMVAGVTEVVPETTATWPTATAPAAAAASAGEWTATTNCLWPTLTAPSTAAAHAGSWAATSSTSWPTSLARAAVAAAAGTWSTQANSTWPSHAAAASGAATAGSWQTTGHVVWPSAAAAAVAGALRGTWMTSGQRDITVSMRTAGPRWTFYVGTYQKWRLSYPMPKAQRIDVSGGAVEFTEPIVIVENTSQNLAGAQVQVSLTPEGGADVWQAPAGAVSSPEPSVLVVNEPVLVGTNTDPGLYLLRARVADHPEVVPRTLLRVHVT
jgi:glycerophosphoryl diester phosphodiesterase